MTAFEPMHARRPSVASRAIYLGGTWARTDDEFGVRQPGSDDEPFATTYHAGADELERATIAALAAEAPLATMPAYARAEALRSVAAGIRERREELAVQLAQEAGKPIKDATVEIERGALTFRIAAEEAERAYGEVLPLDLNAASRGRVGIV